MIRTVTVLLLFAMAATVSAGDSLLNNGDFEHGMDHWAHFWARDNQGTANIVTEPVHAGRNAVSINYAGKADWSLGYGKSFSVTSGDIFELTGWVRTEDNGSVTLGVVLYDTHDKAISWTYGGRAVSHASNWQQVTCRFVIPPKAARIVPRLIGFGAITAWLDDVALSKTGTLKQLRAEHLPTELVIQNDLVTATFFPPTATFTLSDRRNGKTYDQYPAPMPIVLDARKDGERIVFKLLKPDDMLAINGSLELQPGQSEVLVRLNADGPVHSPLGFPRPWKTKAGQYLILPVNEGISYPVSDASLKPMHYHLFGGHGLCMAFWGFTDLSSGLMAIVETPDDAVIDVLRTDGRLCLTPQWLPQKTRFGAERQMRIILLDQGGYVAMCKRYRQYARKIGRLKTLASKRKENPNVDRLIGAVNVWNWDMPAVETCRMLQKVGIQRVLWSHRNKPDAIRQLNAMDVLSSRYDIYQDAMNPADFPNLRGRHPDWTSNAWPDDIIIGKDGQWTRGWRVKGKDGKWYPCGVLCDSQAVRYAQRRIPAELETHPYLCRFIDTTTAAAWRECYSPRHPMTRTDSRRFRMKLLQYVSKTCGLVTGSETGIDAAVPYVHYFEGMLSLGPYRVPDAGRAMMEIVTDVPKRVAKFQTGHYYRLPLWELVYHDCVVAQWYWGDYNNKLPSLWDRRDLLNALYGTPPMFMFNRKIWQANQDRFVRSYQTATPVARATGYAEMLSHKWLTEDHAVQQTRFANGVVVTVNLGDKPYTADDRFFLKPLAVRMQGMPKR